MRLLLSLLILNICAITSAAAQANAGGSTAQSTPAPQDNSAKAKALIFSGRAVDAEEALSLGVADRLSAPDTLVAEAQAWAAELSRGSKTAIALGKTILNQTFEVSPEQVFALGSQAQGICYTSAEHREAVMAFLDKSAQRAPKGDA